MTGATAASQPVAIAPHAAHAANSPSGAAATSWYIIQVGSFQQQSTAEKEIATLNKKGVDAYYRYEDTGGKGMWYRVYYGSFPTYKAAEAAAEQMIRDGLVKACLLRKVLPEKNILYSTDNGDTIPSSREGEKDQRLAASSYEEAEKGSMADGIDSQMSTVVLASASQSTVESSGTDSILQRLKTDRVEGSDVDAPDDPFQAAEVDPFADVAEDPFKDTGEDPFGDVAEDPFKAGAPTDDQGSDPWDTAAPDAAPWDEGPGQKRFTTGGRVWNKFSVDTENDDEFEDLYQNHVQGQVDLTYAPTSSLFFKVGVGGDYYTYGRDRDRNDDANFRLFDAYLNMSGKYANLKVGNQIVRWGKADGFSPLDILNPEDFRDGIGGRREDRKLQIPMVNLELFAGIFTLQGIYIPVFIQSEYDIRETDWALLNHYEEQVGPVSVVEDNPANTLENGEGGARLSSTIGRFDYALSYFYGYEDVGTLDSLTVPPGFDPTFSSRVIKDLVGYAHATNQPIRLRHDRQQTAGFEFETTVAAFGLRGDLAYTDRVSLVTDQLQRIRKPVFQYVVGADYHGPGAFYLNIQFGQNFISDFDDSIILARELTSNINGTISKKFFDDDLKLEFRWYYDFHGDGTLYNPKLIIDYWQNVTLELGVEIFDGTDYTPLGFYRDNSQYYGLIELSF
ncbi:SPOR domain-containing protein [Desulfosarcina sp.]|uniref:SPOR domain-containing protein n=1 Tax=Desulfosarcina sp. TaxID=2027861 RepID=UPI003569EE5A